MHYLSIKKDEWDKALDQLRLSQIIFAAAENEYGIDYEVLNSSVIGRIAYNKAKPATSLKSFFLPVKENVTSGRPVIKHRIIIGAPNCDVAGLKLLDEIYLDKDFADDYYRTRRENTIIISFDCFEKQTDCHCTTYGISPWSEDYADLSIISIDDLIILRVLSENGNTFTKQLTSVRAPETSRINDIIESAHNRVKDLLSGSNRGLPDYATTGILVAGAGDEIWKKYSSRCVSCGACTTICPTCSCFLLIDQPDFGKVRQVDACQYPGFERVAGGEDPLFELPARFRNRYMCKYVWKPERFNSPACTGCGRCIEACIGKISKNELFMDLANEPSWMKAGISTSH